jgi:thiol-disulfide isomerase/thioredoxin
VIARWLFTWFGLIAAAAGSALWWAMRPVPADPMPSPPDISPAALSAASFTGADGRRHAIGELQGKVVVLNFWATWCAPCREEMPTFEKLQREWAGRVQFVGLSDEDAAKVGAFARSNGITYPLWTGGDEVDELSHRLGNSAHVLPFSAVLDARGNVVAAKVGTYPEDELRKAVIQNSR